MSRHENYGDFSLTILGGVHDGTIKEGVAFFQAIDRSKWQRLTLGAWRRYTEVDAADGTARGTH